MTWAINRVSLSMAVAISVLTGSVARGADLPIGPGYVPPPPIYNWEGFYSGRTLEWRS